jgi:hypothetical protein
VQTDWGGEYQRLNSLFIKQGISHLVSCPHAHQQNGPAERKHRHIVDVGLTLLAHASMPLKFWDEAFSTAAYLINRTPTKLLDYSTPLEHLYNQAPNYPFLKVFGCACWPNLRPYNTRKLAFRSTRCAFLGYSPMHKGYKCLDISTGRIYISRDVVFDEAVFPFAELHSNAGARLRTKINLLPSTLLPSSNIENRELCPTTDSILSNNPPVATNVESSQDANNGVQVTGPILPSVDVSAAPQPVVEHSRPAENPPAAVQNSREYITYKRQPRVKKVIGPNSTTDAGSDPASLIPEVSSLQVSGSEVSAVPGSASASAPETVIYTDQRPCTRLRDGTATRVKYGCFTSTGEPQSLSEALGYPN